MATINWDELSETYNGDWKEFAPDGVHKVKVDKAQNRTTSTGTVWQELYLQDDDNYAYPKISHPLSQKNANWRAWHWKQLFVALGASEADARKVVESCEGKPSFDKIASAYEQSMNRLAQKHPTIEIEVWREPNAMGKVYARADFNSGVRMSRPDDQPAPQAGSASSVVSEVIEGATEADDLGELPF